MTSDKFQLPKCMLFEFNFVQQQNILHCDVDVLIILKKENSDEDEDKLVIFFLT